METKSEITDVWMQTFERHPEKVLEVQMTCVYEEIGYALNVGLTTRGRVKLKEPVFRHYPNGITKPIFLSQLPRGVRQWFNSMKPALLIALKQ